MKKLWFVSIIVISLLTVSCGSSKRLAYNDVSTKLDTQFSIYKGTPYKYGGTTKAGFDCSGYVLTVYEGAFSMPLPRSTEAMMKEGKKVAKSKLKPGDLVFFRPTRRYKHVGIYMGNNLFMHSSTSSGVIKSNINNPYWKKKYKFAKRILKVK
ncbi:MAG: NlpC/P60 family protein [Flavobacteriaceae bacterium]|jgi:cell wall-associated NlpC family hydrolase|nr:C40 family peptidase [Flavobacteriaceae bacterium]MCB0484787.1 C40 family peptidase [Flavobacteriaceae bacterium]